METELTPANPDGARMANYKILNGNAIKFIAIVAMTIDHIA